LRPRRRPDLRPRRDGGRRVRGRRRPRADRGDGPPPPRARRRQAVEPARLITAAWICLFLPLGAALAITLAGTRISRRAAGYLATASVALAFAAAVASFVSMLGRAPDVRSETSTAWSWLTAGTLHFGLEILVDPLAVLMM